MFFSRQGKKVETVIPLSCVITTSVCKSGQGGADQMPKSDGNGAWYENCHYSGKMKTVFLHLSKRPQIETFVSVILAIGLCISILIPSPRSRNALAGIDGFLFSVTDDDFFGSPLFSSAKAIRSLNCIAGEWATFAGYNDFHTRLVVSNSIYIANVTRFSGDLISLLNIGFAEKDVGKNIGARVYISEEFWQSAFARDPAVIGTEIVIHDTTYSIAGITKQFRGLLSETDIWMPSGGNKRVEEEYSMRIVGHLNPGADLRVAQKTMNRILNRVAPDLVLEAGQKARLIPIYSGVFFDQQRPKLALDLRRFQRTGSNS